MRQLTILAAAVFILASQVGQARADDESKTMDLVARANQLPKGYAEYGVLLGFPAGPEQDPPVAEWKYSGIGSWITGTIFVRIGVTEKIEIGGWGSIALGHPENPGERPNRMGGGTLIGTYRITNNASAVAGLSFVDPWLAMYGLTAYQHYYTGNDLEPAAHLGGRFGTVVGKRFRLQAEPRLTLFAGDETWILAELMARADTRVVDNFFVGIRAQLRTGDELSLKATDGATLPVIAELRYVFNQVDLGVDVGFGSVLTSKNFASRVAYAEVPSSFYFGAVMNWRLP